MNNTFVENTDIHFISDFSLPEMKILSSTLAQQNVAINSYSLNTLIEKHKNTPQDKCPLVFEGHGGHGGGHGDGHGESHGNNYGDSHGGDHGKYDDDHHGKDDHGNDDHYDQEYTVQDFQTDKLSYYTIAQEYPDNFARPSTFFE